jgi:hypothetical protein
MLQGTQLGDESVPILAKMSKLRLLKLQETRFSAQGIDALAKSLPNCRIEWDGGVIEPSPAEESPPAEATSP